MKRGIFFLVTLGTLILLAELSQRIQAQQSNSPAVHGTGTTGKVPIWAGTSAAGNPLLGDSIITELNGNIGIDTATPASKLTVPGLIHSTFNGFKFPDGSIQ